MKRLLRGGWYAHITRSISCALTALLVALALFGVITVYGRTANAHANTIPGREVGGPRASAASNPPPTGFVPNPQAQPVMPATFSGTLPAAVDLSYYNPSVADQRQVGSCVAWATEYYLRGWYA